MPHITSLESLHLNGAWLTIGVFDGVHRGHQEIIRQLTAGAHQHGAPAVLLSFSPHPAVFFGAKDLKCLTTPEERAKIIEALGVDYVVTQTFNQDVASQTAEEYMAHMLRHLGVKKLLIGYDFALGKGRAGNYEKLSQIGQELGFDVERVEAITSRTGSSPRVLSASGSQTETWPGSPPNWGDSTPSAAPSTPATGAAAPSASPPPMSNPGR
jgi:riboflavin kinase/FMN adenylyltransferase